MILSYGGENCWCFKERAEIDLQMNANVPLDISLRLPAATAMCFRGANASGKTNGLKILAFISLFTTESFMLAPNDNIPFQPFFDSGKESFFHIAFTGNEASYRYELTARREGIIEEKLYRKDSRERLILRREGNAITINTLYKGHKDIPLRTNASIISTLHQYGLQEISDIYTSLSNFHSNVSYQGKTYQDPYDYLSVTRYLHDNPEILEEVVGIISRFDTGIENITIRKRHEDNGKDLYIPVFHHTREGKEPFPMLYEDESNGTKRLYNTLIYYLQTIEMGGLLIFDEFDTNLHPDILPYILDMFIIKKNNRKNAQIIFTTQSNLIMDILGRYRTYIFEKENGESICFRVDEIKSGKLRNDRPISIPYEKKLLGGVPKIE